MSLLVWGQCCLRVWWVPHISWQRSHPSTAATHCWCNEKQPQNRHSSSVPVVTFTSCISVRPLSDWPRDLLSTFQFRQTTNSTARRADDERPCNTTFPHQTTQASDRTIITQFTLDYTHSSSSLPPPMCFPTAADPAHISADCRPATSSPELFYCWVVLQHVQNVTWCCLAESSQRRFSAVHPACWHFSHFCDDVF